MFFKYPLCRYLIQAGLDSHLSYNLPLLRTDLQLVLKSLKCPLKDSLYIYGLLGFRCSKVFGLVLLGTGFFVCFEL